MEETVGRPATIEDAAKNAVAAPPPPRKRMTLDEHKRAAAQIAALRAPLNELEHLTDCYGQSTGTRRERVSAVIAIDRMEAQLNVRFITEGNPAKETPYFAKV